MRLAAKFLTNGGGVRVALWALLAILMVTAAVPLSAAPRETRTRTHTPVAVMPPAAVTPPVAPPVATPLTPAELGAGICQCIADQTARRLSCMSSAEACQTTCGSHYAFVPHAVSCPIAGAEPQAK